MNKAKILLALLFCTATLCQQNNCPGFYGGDLLQTGTQIVQQSSPPGQATHNYSFRVLFNIPSTGLDIGVTTSTIARYNPNNGFSYNLAGTRQGSSQYVDVVVTIPENQSWESLLVNYIFSGRTDIAVGNFVADFFWWKPLSPGVYEATHGIDKALLANQNYQVAVFVSGLSTSDSSFEVSINQPYYSEASKTVGVIFSYDSNPNFQYITFSYIVYPRTHPVLKFDYRQNIPSQLGSYYFTGPVDMENSDITYNFWRVVNRNIPCNGNGCPNNCVLLEECIEKGGNIWQDQCYFCPEGIVFANGRCSRRCGANQVFFNRVCFCDSGFVRQGNDCVKEKSCGTNQVWSDKLDKCVCDSTSINYGQKCVICPPNSLPNLDQTTCECLNVGYEYNDVANTCDAKCPSANQVWGTDKCVCIDRYSWWNADCRICPSNSDPNPAQTTCVCRSANQIYDANRNACESCQSNAVPNDAKTGCVCRSGYAFDQNNQCVQVPPVCIINEIYNPQTNSCDCVFGFQRVVPGTPCVSLCGQNEEWTGTNCVCLDGFARYNGQPCRRCPAPTVSSPDRKTCLCLQDNYYFNANQLVCLPCQANSAPSADDTKCICNAGWTLQGSACVSNCPSNSSPNSKGKCICNVGFYKENNQCKPQPTCPPNSIWNSALLTCECQNAGENLIDGVCKECGPNEGWSGVECLCKAGLNRFQGNCVKCNSQAFWNGKECECNGGWYGDGLTCQRCHSSCRKCTGPNANQCTECTDISLTFQSGFCRKDGVCDPGTFLDGNSCSQCSENCLSCSNIFECGKCTDGFEPVTIPFGAQAITACSEICGDGTRFTEECDDGNTKNDDGCNEYCEIESGWNCNGGGALKPDFCTQTTPQSIVLTSKGAVNLGSEIVFNVKANYLPPCVTNFECSQCNNALDVKLVSALNYASYEINFNPFTKYQWNVSVKFDEIIAVAVKFSVKINEQYIGKNNCFRPQDFEQQLVIAIDEPRDLLMAGQLDNLTGVFEL